MIMEFLFTDVQKAVELLEILQKCRIYFFLWVNFYFSVPNAFIKYLAGEFDNSKLAALQKVLQSEFCVAVREVYEHVYETVDLSGSPEVRANATAKVVTKVSCEI